LLSAGLAADALGDAASDEIRYVVDTNLTAIMTTARGVIEHMAPGGDIVFIGSISANVRAGSSVYVAAKVGVQALAEALRKELAG